MWQTAMLNSRVPVRCGEVRCYLWRSRREVMRCAYSSGFPWWMPAWCTNDAATNRAAWLRNLLPPAVSSRPINNDSGAQYWLPP
jgi:hypothetical protein